MKKLIISNFILAGVLPLMLFAQSRSDVVGTWTWSGNGCRDRSLSDSSHVSKSPSAGSLDIDVAILNFRSNGTATMRATMNGQEMNNRGTWQLNGDTIEIVDSDSGESAEFPLKLKGDWLIFEDKEDEAVCGRDQVFVRVFGKVS